jgi:hypothetical protein
MKLVRVNTALTFLLLTAGTVAAHAESYVMWERKSTSVAGGPIKSAYTVVDTFSTLSKCKDAATPRNERTVAPVVEGNALSNLLYICIASTIDPRK